MDDEELVSRASQGDREAFAAIVNRYQDELYNMALRLLGSPADAADVVQETFTRAFTRIGDIRGATLRPWLYRVAVNCGRDIFRRQSRHPADPIEDSEGNVIDLPDPSMGPEEGALGQERATAIRDALQQLPHDSRTIVVLRDINDLSYEEIAVALRIPVGTVKSRLSRARLQLTLLLRQSTVLFPAAEGES